MKKSVLHIFLIQIPEKKKQQLQRIPHRTKIPERIKNQYALQLMF